MKRFLKSFHYGHKGFTLIELLVVVAILGILAAIVVPNVAKFIGEGEQEAKDTEHHNLQTSVLALMADCKVGTITGDTGVQDYDSVHGITATGTGGTHHLDEYIVGFDSDDTLKQAYDIDTDGSVYLTTPPE